MCDTDNINKKFLLKNGRQVIDYVFDAGFGLGGCIFAAVKCRYNAGIERDPIKQDQLMKACNWYIDSLARRGNIVREEIVTIVRTIVSKIEADMIVKEVIPEGSAV